MASEAIAYIPPPPPEIIVWGERSRPLGTAPNFLRWAAGFLSGTGRAVEYVDRKIREEVPFAEFALEAISFAAGPASYAAGKIIMASPLGNQIERAAGRIASWAAGRLRGAGIDPTEAAYAASGAIFLGGLAFGARRALDLTRDIRYALGLGGKRSVVVAAESATVRARRLGREGEAAAGITGPKVGVEINGRMRFPDEITPTTIREVKNVGRQGWTSQLKDYADLARSGGKTFELWVRAGPPGVGTTISRNLRAAELRGDVIIRRELPGQ